MAEPIVHLIVQYCNDPRPPRQAEYEECVRRNLANPWVKGVHNLVEEGVEVPAEFRGHTKYRERKLGRWMTYRDALDYAAAELAGEVVGILNLDIFLDPSADWAAARETVSSGIVLCLSRHEWAGEGQVSVDPGLAAWAFANSQDAWVFHAPLEVPACDFEVGTLGCDNAFAERVVRSGRVPVNAGSRFRIFHIDQARGKSFANQSDVHAAERAARPRRRPELEGEYMLPDIDRLRSVDQLLDALKIGEVDRYRVLCDVMSRFVKAGNP